MIRTQIHLDEDLIVELDREAARTGASRSEIIRRALRRRFPSDVDYAATKEHALEQAFGAWQDRKFKDGEEYLRALRSGDWDTIHG